MKAQICNLNQKSSFHVTSIAFFLLFQFGLYNVSGQDQNGTTDIKLLGSGKDYYILNNADNGYQRNDYKINLFFDITAIPKMSSFDGSIIYDIIGIGGEIKILCGIEDDVKQMTYGVDYSKGYYVSSDISLGTISYSTDENKIKKLEFSIPRTEAPNKRNTEIKYEDGIVQVIYEFDFPILEDVMKIAGSASLNGIFLQIIETNNTENVKEVGYKYTRRTSRGGVHEDMFFSVFKTPLGRYAFINKFKDKTIGKGLSSDFDDEIYFFDENRKQIGHMFYEYEYQLNKDHVRNAILILHNDKDINQPGGAIFPYSTSDKEKFDGWDYYSLGEYPVSMLIPPLNKFPENYTKDPILLLHGLNGKYVYSRYKYLLPLNLPNPLYPLISNLFNMFKTEEGILADPNGEDISYWYTTPGILNRNYNLNWDAWQMYYPNNDAAVTIAECLKYDLTYLKSLYQGKVNLVTHSYGGIIARQYLSEYNEDAIRNLKKVLFMAPPHHGSFSANRAYENITQTGFLSQIDGTDPQALCYRDASLGSEVIVNNWNKQLPDLDGSSFTFDDYFVILGATNKYYIAENIHEEAKLHNDGLVAMSSASLIDKNIGFASIYGNHDDAVHAQSNHGKKTNIGQPYLIPNIIHNYFYYDNEKFLNKIGNNEYIKAIVKYDKTVSKPSETEFGDLEYLDTPTNEKYQRSLLCLDFINIPTVEDTHIPDKIAAYYNKDLLEIKIYCASLIESPIWHGYERIGEFWRNEITDIYYFHENWSGTKNLLKISDGCAIDLKQGTNTISIILDDFNYFLPKELEIGYCQSHLISFDWKDTFFESITFNGKTASKEESIISENNKNGYINSKISEKSSSGKIDFFVDDQTSITTFLISSEQASNNSFSTYLQQPNGETYNNTEWLLDTSTNLYSIQIDSPMPGTWQVWAEDSNLENDTLWYQAQALFQSYIILYDANEQQIDVLDDYKLAADVVLPDKDKLSEIALKATIISPGNIKSEIDFSANQLATDSSYVYSVPLNQDTTGIYSISIECTGIYDGYNFERVVSSQIEVADRTPYLYIPDIYLDGLKQFEKINIENQVFCQGCNSENYTYSYNIINNNDILVNIDSLSVAFITSNFTDTTASSIEFIVKENEHVVCRDTVSVFKNLPDLKFLNFQISDTTFVAEENISLSFDIFNDGNSYTNNGGKVGLVLSEDRNFDKSDMIFSIIDIPVFSPYDTIPVAKDFPFPGGISFKYSYLLVVADIDSVIYESDKGNNTISRKIDFTPQTEYKKMVTVNKDNGELVFTDPNSYIHSSLSYNGYDVSKVSWWNNNYIWAYAGGNELPIWINYQFNIDNYENLDSINVVFRARGTTSEGVFYSYLYEQINNVIVSDNQQQLINSTEWSTYALMLPKSYFYEGINQVKIGTSAGSQTYVALNGIAIEFYYSQNTVVVHIGSPSTIKEKNIQVYPNPANNVLFIDGLTENIKLAMYEITGKLIIIKKIANNQFDISHLQSGMYLVKVETSEGIVTEKFVKQ
jgi:pimeloyl-ACP methyl ester carboxylesterase